MFAMNKLWLFCLQSRGGGNKTNLKQSEDDVSSSLETLPNDVV